MNASTINRPDPEARDRVAHLLNCALADEFALSAVTRDYHWNVSGPQSRRLHEVFDEQYHQLDTWIERIGERARALGLSPRAGWRDLVRARRFRPPTGAGLHANEMITGLAALHEGSAERLRVDQAECAGLHDPVSARLLDELVEYHDTTAWLLGELKEQSELAPA